MKNFFVLILFMISALTILTVSIAQESENIKGPNAKKIGELISIAATHKQANEFQLAIESYEEACQLAPESKILKHNLMSLHADYAKFSYDSNDIDLALEEYEKVMSFENPSATYCINYARILVRQNRDDEALTNFERALQVTGISKNAEIMVKLDMCKIFFKKGMDNETLILLEPLVNECESAEVNLMAGNLYYKLGNFDKAIQTLTDAVKFSNGDKYGVSAKKMLEIIQKEGKVEAEFETRSVQHFYVQYEKNKKNDFSIDEVINTLETAYGEVGTYFNYYPQTQIPVLIYSSDQYHNLFDNNKLSAGGYNGKIRLPLEKLNISESAMYQIIFHEYTHAVVYMLFGKDVPIWLNEGFAQMTLFDDADESQEARIINIVTSGQNFKMSEIDEAFSDRSTSAVSIRCKAYDQSYSFTKFIVEKFGKEKIINMMSLLSKGKSVPEILKENFETDYKQLEIEWKSSIANSAKL